MPRPHIIVWCLPKETQKRLEMLFYVLVRSLTGIPELCVSSEKDVLINFPPDSMRYGLGTEIVVQVSELDKDLGLTPAVRRKLAKALGAVLDSWYPKSAISVRLDAPFDAESDGYWSNKKPVLHAEGIAAMSPAEFFSSDRLSAATDDPKMITRLRPIIDYLLKEDPRTYETLQFSNMAEFSAHYPSQRKFERAPNCGKVGAGIIGDVMRASGFKITRD